MIESASVGTCVGEAHNGQEAIEKARELQPEIVILDLSMPEMGGEKAIRPISLVSPRTRVVIFTMFDTESLIEETIRAGAVGYVVKTAAAEDLIEAVVAVNEGRTYFGSPMAKTVWQRYIEANKGEVARVMADALTTREKEILVLLAEGKSNVEVGTLLDISVRTVENHRARIMRKSGVNSFGELLRLAIRSGLIQA